LEFRGVQSVPFSLVITRFPPLLATATHRPFPYATDRQAFSGMEVRDVQLIPSGLVITRLPVPLAATATHRPFPYATELHPRPPTPEVRLVQVIPSELVITLPLPTATHRLFPYATDCQLPEEEEVRGVQVIPSELVITSPARPRPPPSLATATHRGFPLGSCPYATEVQILSAAFPVVQVIPSA
jgi:hypothetical protein